MPPSDDYRREIWQTLKNYGPMKKRSLQTRLHPQAYCECCETPMDRKTLREFENALFRLDDEGWVLCDLRWRWVAVDRDEE